MKINKYLKTKLVCALTIFSLATPAFAYIDASWTDSRPPVSAFDPGPDYFKGQNPANLNAKKLIDLHAEIPYFPGISKDIMRKKVQKFRPAYGPIPWRMILKPNNVKILFIGQDGTHVAEAAGRPATAGFGGRAQDLAAFFGVEYSAGFINTYAFTIKGQYGSRGAPYVYDGQVSTRGTIIPNDVWLMSQDQDSPIQQWRSDLIEWIINNNKESLKLIVLFGGSAKDSVASFIESRGGKVGSRNESKMDLIQVPEFFNIPSGGNAEFPVAFNKAGKDAYSELLGKKLDYKNAKVQQEVAKYLEQNDAEAIKKMVFSKAGPYKNGLIHHAQMGGYNLDQIYVDKNNARPDMATRSLKGLKLKNGGEIKKDILVVALPHPTFLSHTMNDGAIAYWENELKDSSTYKALKAKAGNVPKYKKLDFLKKVFSALPNKVYAKQLQNDGYAAGKEKVGNLVEKDVAKLRPYADKGWNIPADAGDASKANKNTFQEGKQYAYGRSDIHSVYYDFGTPKNRMVSKSTARRGSHKQDRRSRGAQVIIFGARDIPSYDKDKMNEMLSAKPNKVLDPKQMFISRARTKETRYEFDPGPAKEFAKLMKDIDYDSLYAAKDGKSFSRDGISAFNIKSHPSVGDFGHYRGTFKNPKVVILADPDGFDDLITARALTGTRGQYLQGLMDDLGVDDQYLIIKTLPYGMDGASEEDWENALKITTKPSDYRKNLIQAILAKSSPQLIIADGSNARAELDRILTDDQKENYVYIGRKGLANNSGITSTGNYIARSMSAFSGKRAKGNMHNIPKSHLTYYARIWEGTSGDRVLNSKGIKEAGLAFSEVVPNWVMDQKPEYKQVPIKKLKAKLKEGGFPLPSESIPQYLKRSKQPVELDEVS
jgi:hypothetical protein